MKVYLSSTFEDLKAYRAAASTAIRRLGHQVVQMEDYGASYSAPLAKVVEDVLSCDALVGLYAWERGSVPSKATQTKVPELGGVTLGEHSFTQWELAAAQQAEIPTLLFMLEENAPWPPHFIEGLNDPEKLRAVREFRDNLRRDNLVAHFREPDDLEKMVGTSLTASDAVRQFRLSLVEPAALAAASMFSNREINTSSIGSITESLTEITKDVVRESDQRTIKIDLKTGWWSTRLFLLAHIAQELTQIRRILITETTGDGAKNATDGAQDAKGQDEVFKGLVPVDTVVSTIGAFHPELTQFANTTRRSIAPSVSIEDEVSRFINEWKERFKEENSEHNIAKKNLAAGDLSRWFGHALLTRPLRIRNAQRPTGLELALVMNYPHQFVPLEWVPELPSVSPDPKDENKKTQKKQKAQKAQKAQKTQTNLRFDVVDQAELSGRISQRFVNDQLGRIGIGPYD